MTREGRKMETLALLSALGISLLVIAWGLGED